MSKYILPRKFRKKFRKIVIHEEMYAWKVDESIPTNESFRITILNVKSGYSIIVLIEVKSNYLVCYNDEGGKSSIRILPENLTITPAYIRKVVLHAIQRGWDCNADLLLQVNQDIGISTHVLFSFPTLKEDEVVVIGYERIENQYLLLLNKNLDKYKGEESYYKILPNRIDAEEYMLSNSLTDKEYEFWMVNNENSALASVKSGKIKYFNS